MDQQQVINILIIATIITEGLVSIGACLYAIPLCVIRRFHTPLNLLSLNVCVAAFICVTFWGIDFTMSAFYPRLFWTLQSCLSLRYLEHMVIAQVVYAFCMVSLNRLIAMVYKNKALFVTKKWVAICVSIQWVFAALLPLPVIDTDPYYCIIDGPAAKYRIYLVIIIVVIPAISLAIINSIIFIYARRSTRRVRQTNGESANTPILSQRDAHLLKHMIFMFAVFVCGWTPPYMIRAVTVSVSGFSPIVMQIFYMIPVACILIDIIDLFLYNHELRKYLTNRRPTDLNTRTN